MDKLTLTENCVSIHRKEAEAMARPKKEGKKYVRQNISMDPDQLERVTAFCRRHDRAISWVIRQALDKYLNDNVA